MHTCLHTVLFILLTIEQTNIIFIGTKSLRQLSKIMHTLKNYLRVTLQWILLICVVGNSAFCTETTSSSSLKAMLYSVN